MLQLSQPVGQASQAIEVELKNLPVVQVQSVVSAVKDVEEVAAQVVHVVESTHVAQLTSHFIQLLLVASLNEPSRHLH
jgi:hypothetical protein